MKGPPVSEKASEYPVLALEGSDRVRYGFVTPLLKLTPEEPLFENRAGQRCRIAEVRLCAFKAHLKRNDGHTQQSEHEQCESILAANQSVSGSKRD